MTTAFAADQYAFVYPDGMERSFWNVARNGMLLRYFRKHDIDHVLDVGCGRGIVTEGLHRAGLHVLGVELAHTTPISGSTAPMVFGTDVTCLPASTTDPFTTLALFDVLEHIEQPVDFLRGLLRALPRIERVVLTVPARAELWSHFDEFYGHFRRYDPASLTAELQAAGLSVLDCRYSFHSLYAVMRLTRRLGRERTIHFEPPRGFARAGHRLAAMCLVAENATLPGRIPGSSLMCIAQR